MMVTRKGDYHHAYVILAARCFGQCFSACPAVAGEETPRDNYRNTPGAGWSSRGAGRIPGVPETISLPGAAQHHHRSAPAKSFGAEALRCGSWK